MNGTMTLGAVLGRNQSFEAFGTLPDCWSGLSTQTSHFQVSSFTQVHSSPAGWGIFADSTGGTPHIARCDYGLTQDAHRVWFPEVTTHILLGSVWARAADAPSSGQLHWRLGGSPEVFAPPIAFAAGLEIYQAATMVHSTAGLPLAGPSRLVAANSRALCFLDDALTQVDVMTLHPDWLLLNRESLSLLQQRTGDNRLQRRIRSGHFEFQVPLRWLSGSEASLLNWWWEGQHDLAFTLDSSDSSPVFICRIINSTQPVGRNLRPYRDHWAGRLELAGISDGALNL